MFARSLMVWWRGFLDVQVATPARQSPPKGEIPASSLTRGWWTQAVLLGVDLIAEKNYYE